MAVQTRGYQQGTSPRKIKEQPQVDRRQLKKEREENIYRSRLLREEEVKRRIRAQKQLNGFQIAIIVACLGILLLVACFYFVSLSENKTIRTMTERLQKDLQETEKENALLKLKIENSIDYDEVYVIATEKLGMNLPEKHQVISYKKQAQEYVVRKAEIPHE